MSTLSDRAHVALASVPAEQREAFLNGSRRASRRLAQAAADLCDERAFRRWLASDDEYLAMCAAIGIGRLVAAGRGHLWPLLRQAADDPRWRVREGAVMGLRRIAEADLNGLLDEIEPWVDGSPLLRRAAAAGIAEPRLFTDARVAQRVTLLLERITWTLRREAGGQATRELRRTLGDCWNVVLSANPGYRVSDPVLVMVARPASRRATGTRKGEQDT
jgi:hypothetical protein